MNQITHEWDKNNQPTAGMEKKPDPLSGESPEDLILPQLSPKHRRQLTALIHFLAASSDAQQRERFLDQLLKEI